IITLLRTYNRCGSSTISAGTCDDPTLSPPAQIYKLLLASFRTTWSTMAATSPRAPPRSFRWLGTKTSRIIRLLLRITLQQRQVRPPFLVLDLGWFLLIFRVRTSANLSFAPVSRRELRFKASRTAFWG